MRGDQVPRSKLRNLRYRAVPINYFGVSNVPGFAIRLDSRTSKTQHTNAAAVKTDRQPLYVGRGDTNDAVVRVAPAEEAAVVVE